MNPIIIFTEMGLMVVSKDESVESGFSPEYVNMFDMPEALKRR